MNEEEGSTSQFASNLLASMLQKQQQQQQQQSEGDRDGNGGKANEDAKNWKSLFHQTQVEKSAATTTFESSTTLALTEDLSSRKRLYLSTDQKSLDALHSLIVARLQSGCGEFILALNSEDGGAAMGFTEKEFQAAVENIQAVARSAHAEASVISRKQLLQQQQVTGCLLIRQSNVGNAQDLFEIRIACVGNVDAGKSTLLGVLVSGDLDDGRGRVRVNLFKHKHEIESGRTSSVGMEIMGFDARGSQVIKQENGRKLSWEDVALKSSKVLSFLDLAGHEKYLKTTVFGMTGCSPDYVMLIVGSNAGIVGMTKEHLGLALALNVPVLVVITKVDMCPANILDATIKQITKVLKSPGCRKIPMFIRDMDDVVVTAQNFISERVCPVFQISNVVGTGLDNLRSFLNLLPVYKTYNVKSPAEYQITDTFSVPGVGTVISGTLLNGVINSGESLFLGPDTNGHFVPCVVKSIHRKKIAVSQTTAGQSSSMALKKIKRAFIRKGMMLVGKEINPQAYWEFDAEVLVLYHSSTIAKRYQAMVHCGNIRQTARIVAIKPCETLGKSGKENAESSPAPTIIQPVANVSVSGEELDVIRTGDRAVVRFRFLQYAEYVKPGSRVLFREGRTKGVGKILHVYTTNGESDF